MVNPLTRCMEDYCLPPFATFHARDIAPAVRAAISEYALDLNALEDDLCDADDLCWTSVMDRLEIIDDPLRRLSSILEHLSTVANSPELRAAQDDVQEDILAMQSRRAQSPVVFHAMQTLRASPAFESEFTTEQQRILDRAILHATLKGAALAPHDKDRFNDIALRLDTLSTMALLAQNAVAAGHDGASAAAGPWKLSLEFPVYMPLMKQCTHRPTRQLLYGAFVSKASTPPYDNAPVIQEMLQLRLSRARLLGFRTFADLSLQDKMAPSVAVVEDMLRDLCDKVLPLARAELDEVQVFAAAHGHVPPLAQWDISYWSEKLRKDRYEVDDESIKPYFPFARAADGLEETWHPDVRYFQIRAMDEPSTPVIGHFYVDPYTRPGQKNAGTWCDTIVSRSKVLRTDKAPVRLPVFSLSCNQPPPVDAASSGLMAFGGVQNLFHTFGYGLRDVFTSAEYTAASSADGIEYDAIEIAPQFLSLNLGINCILETLRMISGHVETGDPLPDDLIDKMLAARNFKAATNLLYQLRLGATDMALHHHYDPYSSDKTIFDVQQSIVESFSVRPPCDQDMHICSFSHLFTLTYGAGYYAYIWSDMLAADTAACFDTTDKAEWQRWGRRFRDSVLAKLGILEPMAVYKLFRGRAPQTDALLARYGLQ
ncbi:hypothetical protein DYB25_005995 [Aphanomyces astaci]|uniref:oligopeptidase A n=1 Tax=Aphanomyces astaci TaxID=112090 RepID=A0A397BF16_APHAT|nr:hypothetical protein DYB25_005995 [Aphanomyces astaci]